MPEPQPRVDVVVVGAGFAGLYLLLRLRRLGMSAICFEAASGVGGTWWYNRYPGARCDVESMQYSYAFDEALQQEWRWSERFAAQPEILRYAEHVADRFDLRRDIRFETRVTAAHHDEATGLWHVTTDRGDTVRARACIMATGCLSAPRAPDIPGRDTFRGPSYHTGEWPHHPVDFTGKRVAIIGTGSSGIQALPVIAEQAAEVLVFQRTPNFSIPSRNRPMDAAYEQEWKSQYVERRRKARTMRTGIWYILNDKGALEVPPEERDAVYQARWDAGGTAFMTSFNNLITDQAANDTAAEFVRARIREIVQDPGTAEALCPKDHPIGTKRICVDVHYFEAFNRPNVKLVNLRKTPIEAITPEGVRTSDAHHPVDAIVYATGFDAMTGTLAKIDIAGRDGRRLAHEWEAGPRTLLGLMCEGFPNLFMVTGPGSPSVLSNVLVSIEQHVEWITDALAWMRERGLDSMEPTAQAQEDWVAHNEEVAQRTLYPRAASWYMGANIEGKPRVFLPYIGGVGAYREICDDIAAKGYPGFTLSTHAAPAAEAAE